METIKAKKQEVQFLVGRAFPEYRGRKFKVSAVEKVILHDLNWGGGTRSKYVAVNLSSGQVNSPEIPAPWNHQAEGKTLEMVEGWALLVHSVFCGHDCGITIYIHPNNMAKFLPKI